MFVKDETIENIRKLEKPYNDDANDGPPDSTQVQQQRRRRGILRSIKYPPHQYVLSDARESSCYEKAMPGEYKNE